MSLDTTIFPQNRDQGLPNTINVFLSHDWGKKVGNSYVNHERVREIKDMLVSLTLTDPKYRLNIWFDESVLLPGHDIAPTLKRAIEDTDIFIYFVTRNYQTKYLSGEPDYCYVELQHAIDQRKLKIPVILEESMKIEANREGTFAQILKGIFYSDFSTPPLFVRPNPSLLIGRCQALVHAIKSQYGGLDFSVNRFLEDINNLNPEVLIPNKFIDIEQHLENLVKFQINDWKDAIVNNNISTFYQTINQTLSDRFDYLKKKVENRDKCHVLDRLKNSISQRISDFRDNHKKQCQQFFTDLTDYINFLRLSETELIDNCHTRLHQHYVSSYKNFQALYNEFNDRAKMFEEPSHLHNTSNGHFTAEENRSFSHQFHQVCNRFLNDLQSLASMPDDPIILLEAIVDFQGRTQPNFLNEGHPKLFLKCLKYYNESVRWNGGNIQVIPNFFLLLTTNDHYYFPYEDLSIILRSISKLQYFPLEYYSYTIIQNNVDGLHSSDEEKFMDVHHNNNTIHFNSVTSFFNELCEMSKLHYPFVYRFRNKCSKFDCLRSFKVLSWHMIISYLLDIGAICCGFIAFSIMVGAGFSNAGCVADLKNNIDYCYLDNDLSSDNQIFLASSCLLAIYAFVRALFALKVMLRKSLLFEESVINFLNLVILSTVIITISVSLSTFLVSRQSMSGIYAVTSGYCYDIHCSSHGALTSEGLTSAEIAASVACFNQTLGKGAVTACATRSRGASSNPDIDDHCVFFHGILTMDDIDEKEDTLNVVMILVAIFIAAVSSQWALFVGRSILIRK